MKRIFLLAFFLVAYRSFAQDTLTLKKIKQLPLGDTLIVDCINKGCRTTFGDRYKVARTNDSTYVLIHYIDFYETMYLDGLKVESAATKEKYFYPDGSKKLIKTTWNTSAFYAFIDQIEEIIQSDNAETIKIAGSFCYLILQLQDKSIEKEFKGSISLQNT